MGTRGLLGQVIRGKYKAMYNHWDSHPVGMGRVLGVKLMKFIKSLKEEDLEKMKENLEKIRW